jgi:hypothetical protein
VRAGILPLPNKWSQLTPKSSFQSIYGTVLAAIAAVPELMISPVRCS